MLWSDFLISSLSILLSHFSRLCGKLLSLFLLFFSIISPFYSPFSIISFEYIFILYPFFSKTISTSILQTFIQKLCKNSVKIKLFKYFEQLAYLPWKLDFVSASNMICKGKTRSKITTIFIIKRWRMKWDNIGM